jgi:hypothetical protein
MLQKLICNSRQAQLDVYPSIKFMNMMFIQITFFILESWTHMQITEQVIKFIYLFNLDFVFFQLLTHLVHMKSTNKISNHKKISIRYSDLQ